MLFFTLAKPKLTFTRLSDCMEYLPLAAQWAEDEWGYIRNKGVEYREGVMHALQHDIYIGTYAGQAVALFALFEQQHEFHKAQELMYVYVDKEYRGLGFGKQIIEEAKRLAATAGADLILLDTLKPSLNRLYEKHGATVVCEGRLFSHPTEVLRMSI